LCHGYYIYYNKDQDYNSCVCVCGVGGGGYNAALPVICEGWDFTHMWKTLE